MTLPLFDDELSPHTCHARDCSEVVKPELLMCRRHWFMVPYVLRQAVWNTYRPGQCDDKRPSGEWHEAASAAIGYIAKREGKPYTKSEADALKAYGF